MFCARVFLFRLHESPRYLASQQKSEDALAALKKIAAFNARPMRLELRDVEIKATMDDYHSVKTDEDRSAEHADNCAGSPKGHASSAAAHPGIISSNSSAYIDFSTATEYGTPPLAEDNVPSGTNRSKSSAQSSFFHTPSEELGQAQAFHTANHPPKINSVRANADSGEVSDDDPFLDLDSHGRSRKMRLRKLLENGLAKLKLLFLPSWKRTTILMWMIWGLMSLAYGM